jgi:hypothetical protein
MLHINSEFCHLQYNSIDRKCILEIDEAEALLKPSPENQQSIQQAKYEEEKKFRRISYIQAVRATTEWRRYCYQVVERYLACRCIYYVHAVDRSPSCNLVSRHDPNVKTLLVGFLYPFHTA